MAQKEGFRLKDNPAFELVHEQGEHKIYKLVNIMELHTKRYVEAINQHIYANAGATRENIQATVNEMLLRCNTMKSEKTFRTDMAALAQTLQYRLDFPVDKHCAIRMGATLSFMEIERGRKVIVEDPENIEGFWIDKKVELALDYPDSYAFFLTWGMHNIPMYSERSDILNDSDYFQKREMAIRSFRPSEEHSK